MANANGAPQAPPNEYYEVRSIQSKGYGCIALKLIKRGTRILAEDPLLVVPIAEYLHTDIQKAFDKLSPNQQKLYYTLHSNHGQDPKKWPTQIHDSVEPLERQRIQEQHRARVGKEPSLISIFQTNCMEMRNGAAIFPNAARFNHSCNPNACFTWNEAIGKETIHIMNDVKAGEEITLSYCDMTHEKTLRAYELKHYGFVCDCRACVGDDNAEGSFAAESAERRFRLQELDRETRFLRGKRLEDGAKQDGFVEKLLEMAVLHQKEGEHTARLATVYVECSNYAAEFLDIALICELNRDVGMAARAIAKAVQIKNDCQGADFPDFCRYDDVLQRIKAKLAL